MKEETLSPPLINDPDRYVERPGLLPYLNPDRCVVIAAFTLPQDELRKAFCLELHQMGIPYGSQKIYPLRPKVRKSQRRALPEMVRVNYADAAEALACYDRVKRRKQFR